MAKFPGKLIQERNRTKHQGILLRVCCHSHQKKKREAKLKMHADILPIATILITYCLFYILGLPIGYILYVETITQYLFV